MPFSVRVFNALVAALLSAAAILAAGMTAQTHGAPAGPVADTSPAPSGPATLTWG
ncbi:MAG TPA: hypothetical protein VFU73_00315 [Actinocrinis sp.]|nr:hypothetical protein [Actinocrinis sp.]